MCGYGFDEFVTMEFNLGSGPSFVFPSTGSGQAAQDSASLRRIFGRKTIKKPVESGVIDPANRFVFTQKA